MDKKTFVGLLEGLKKQMEHDEKCNALLEQVFPDAYCVFWDNSAIEEAVIVALEEAMNDKEVDGGGGLVRYFVYELDFGADSDRKKIIDGSEEICLKTPENLFDYLTACNLRD